jgi:lipopolysaccharide export system permease protein
VFVETLSDDGLHVGNVFIQSRERGRMGVTVARQGNVREMENGDSFLVLEQGKRYEGLPGEADFWMSTFDRYALRIPPQAIVEKGPSPRMLPVSPAPPESRAAQHGRVGLARSATRSPP